MSRYFTQPKVNGKSRRPRANYIGDGYTSDDPLIPDVTVDDHVAVDTGLVDQRGDAILRAPETMGFHSPK